MLISAWCDECLIETGKDSQRFPHGLATHIRVLVKDRCLFFWLRRTISEKGQTISDLEEQIASTGNRIEKLIVWMPRGQGYDIQAGRLEGAMTCCTVTTK